MTNQARNEMIERLVAHLVNTAQFWIKNGTAPAEAFEIALSQSCAGPLPRRIAAERLGL
jgi:hypothetical protein